MVDSNFYVENSANSPMHYGDKPRVGVIDFPDRLPIRRPYNYFEAQSLYNNLTQDMWVQQEHANPERVKKGVPKIIKIALGLIVVAPLIFMSAKGIQNIIANFKH
jgi:hypothetical protein